MRDNIVRNAEREVIEALDINQCVLLLGPRQVGKTHLSQIIRSRLGDAVLQLDMDMPAERGEMGDLAVLAGKNRGRLIIIDEAQNAPEIFPQLKVLLDREQEGVPGSRWLLLGSSRTDLQTLAGGHLGGRYGCVDLTGLSLVELIDNAVPTAMPAPALPFFGGIEEVDLAVQFDASATQDKHWCRGGMPRAYLAADCAVSMQWRQDYLRSIFAEARGQAGLQSAEILPTIWDQLCNRQGETVNWNDLPNRVGARKAVVEPLLRLLEERGLIRSLPHWSHNAGRRADKPARFYVRDSGLLHSTLGLSSIENVKSSVLYGKSWEGYVLENLACSAPPGSTYSYFRYQDRNEIDIVVRFPSGEFGVIEIKAGNEDSPERGYFDAIKQMKIEPKLTWLINGATESLGAIGTHGLHVLCLHDALATIRQGII